MVSVTSVPKSPAATPNGMRPINLSTDLGSLADLIELVFAETMDSSGRAALREMRMLSKFGRGVNLLQRLGDTTLGIQQGFVWVEDGKLISNVSIYPAKNLGQDGVWIIANVGTHPEYRRRGIARELMVASLNEIRKHGGKRVVLQVDYTNDNAQQLYYDLGFTAERAWTVWRRASNYRSLMPNEIDRVYITHPRRADRRTEYALASRLYPNALGGLGWLRPLKQETFMPNFIQRLRDMVNMRAIEHLIIRSSDERDVHAALLVERVTGLSTRLSLIVPPEYVGYYDEALISTAVRRFGGEAMVIEHPYDETITAAILERYHFRRSRSAYHMRFDFA